MVFFIFFFLYNTILFIFHNFKQQESFWSRRFKWLLHVNNFSWEINACPFLKIKMGLSMRLSLVEPFSGFWNLWYIDKKMIFWRLIFISFYKCNKSVKISVKTIFPCILILIHKLHTTFTVYIKRIPFG